MLCVEESLCDSPDPVRGTRRPLCAPTMRIQANRLLQKYKLIWDFGHARIVLFLLWTLLCPERTPLLMYYFCVLSVVCVCVETRRGISPLR